MSAERISLPTLREFTESVPELGIEKGDRVWITHDSAVVVRTFSFTQIRPHFDLTQPVRLKAGKASG